VRWGECDPAGVVYTPRFADYAVEAYHDFLQSVLDGPLQRRLVDLDLGTPARSLTLTFTRSLWPDDEIELHVRVNDVRQRSFDIVIDATKIDGTQAFSAAMGFVCVHHAARQARPIPPFLRERLCAYRDLFPVSRDNQTKTHELVKQ
jgi:acyl-CoA thioesterase FadM